MKVEINNRYTQAVLYTADVPDEIDSGLALRQVLEKAVSDGANLGGANLGGAYLSGANLGSTNLDGANLRAAKGRLSRSALSDRGQTIWLDTSPIKGFLSARDVFRNYRGIRCCGCKNAWRKQVRPRLSGCD